MTLASASSRVDNIRHSLVGLKMPRALEMLDATLRRIEQGESTESRRSTIMALAGLDFINRAEVIHLLGPPGTGKSHLATALAVEAVRAGKASTSFRWPISSPSSPKPNVRAPCGRKSASCAAVRYLSSTKSATCRLPQVAATCSSSSSMPAMKGAR